MSRGSASWLLPWPETLARHEWHPRSCPRPNSNPHKGKSPWGQWVAFCQMLKRTKARYQVEYVALDTGLKAMATWEAGR